MLTKKRILFCVSASSGFSSVSRDLFHPIITCSSPYIDLQQVYLLQSEALKCWPSCLFASTFAITAVSSTDNIYWQNETIWIVKLSLFSNSTLPSLSWLVKVFFSSGWTWGRRVFTPELGRRCHYKVLHPGTPLVKIWNNDIFLQFNISSSSQSCDSDQNTTTMLLTTLHASQLGCFCWIQKNYLFQGWILSFIQVEIRPIYRYHQTQGRPQRCDRGWLAVGRLQTAVEASKATGGLEEGHWDTGTASVLSRGT